MLAAPALSSGGTSRALRLNTAHRTARTARPRLCVRAASQESSWQPDMLPQFEEEAAAPVGGQVSHAPSPFSPADRAILRALATRPELPEGVQWEPEAMADSGLIQKWHEAAWSAVAAANASSS